MSNIAFSILYTPVQLAGSPAAADEAMLAMIESPLFYPVMFLTFVFFAMKIILGIRANHFYFSHCCKKINTAKEKTPDLSSAELTSAGGVTVGLAALTYVISSIVIEAITILFL